MAKRMDWYNLEYTDTFGGDANYSWVKRCRIGVNHGVSPVRAAKREVGLSGVRGVTEDYGTTISFKPYSACVVLFIMYDENSQEPEGE